MDLLILPFDHRSSFSKNILGVPGTPNKKQAEKIAGLKDLVYEGFLRVRNQIDSPEELGILVDEQYGSEIIQKAKKEGIITAVGVEKSGQDIFQFEYGRKFGKHIDKLQPSYVKVLVRYNPENKSINKKQLRRLKRLSKFCEKNDYDLLFELLVPPTEKDLKSDADFDQNIRPEKTAEAIEEIRKKVKAKIWKLEGFSSQGWDLILPHIPAEEKVIVLGRGEDSERVKFWLTEAAKYDQIIGFAIGRTIFMQPLMDHLHNGLSKEDAVFKIAKNYSTFIDLWRNIRKTVSVK